VRRLPRRTVTVALAVILIVGTGLRLGLSPHLGSQGDMAINQGWMRSAVHFGVVRSFRQQLDGNPLPDHGPVEIGLYALSGHLYRLFVSPSMTVVQPWQRVTVKIPAIFADASLCIILFLLLGRVHGDVAGLVAALVYALHPAAIYDSAVWGQTDGIYMALLVGGFALVAYQRMRLAAACLAAAFLCKAQSLLFLPLLGMLFLRNRRSAIRGGAGALMALFVLLFPFAVGGGLRRLVDVYVHATGDVGTRLSWNAYNLWWMLVGPEAWNRNSLETFIGGISFSRAGWMLFGVAYVALLAIFRRELQSASGGSVALAVAAAVCMGSFVLLPGMHERYLFPFVPLGLVLLFAGARGVALYAGVSLLFFLNLLVVLPFSDADVRFFAQIPRVGVAIASLQVLGFILLLAHLRGWANALSRAAEPARHVDADLEAVAQTGRPS
jgi:Gpi18-like mannosyltransferase